MEGTNPNIGRLPPRIGSAFEKVRGKFPHANLSHVLAAAGKRVSDLPKIEGRSPCYNWLMGKCTRAPACKFAHLDISALDTTVLQEWTENVEKGATALAAMNELPTLQQAGIKRRRLQK